MDERILEILENLLKHEISKSEAQSQLLVLFDVSSCVNLEREVKSRREQITDINQWTEIMIKYRGKIRDRVLWSMINDINNRTTD